jgi:hypothetical protein
VCWYEFTYVYLCVVKTVAGAMTSMGPVLALVGFVVLLFGVASKSLSVRCVCVLVRMYVCIFLCVYEFTCVYLSVCVCMYRGQNCGGSYEFM